MKNWSGKRYWIVGASEGLGRALAEQLSRVGCELVVSARNRDRLDALVDSLPGRAEAVDVDVTSQKDVERAAEAVGRIDGLVHLAGVYWPMSTQHWDTRRAVKMIDVNVSGAIRVLGAVLPQMMASGEGHIVLTGSLAGYRGLRGAVGYGASKAALMSLAETMRADLRHTDILVQIVNPGFVKTRLTEKNDFHMPMLMEPADAAREIFEHMNSDNFARSFPRAMGFAFRGGRFLPEALHHRLFGA